MAYFFNIDEETLNQVAHLKREGVTQIAGFYKALSTPEYKNSLRDPNKLYVEWFPVPKDTDPDDVVWGYKDKSIRFIEESFNGGRVIFNIDRFCRKIQRQLKFKEQWKKNNGFI